MAQKLIKAYFALSFSMLLIGCTYSISMIHSEGSTDTLDENQTATPNISPTVTVPVSSGIPIPSIIPSTTTSK